MSKTQDKTAEGILTLINKIDAKPLSGKQIVELQQGKEKIEKAIKNAMEAKKKIFESYKIEPDDEGNYTWKGHKSEKKITEKIKEAAEVDLKPIKIIDKETLAECVKGLDNLGLAMEMIRLIGKE